MWIAKPMRALSLVEQSAWCAVLEKERALNREVPLAQSLAWGRAIEAVSGQVYVVFSAEECVGGLVFATLSPSNKTGIRFECTNGPLLDWDHADNSKRQLATFATAVAQLSPRFESMVLRPRWSVPTSEARIATLPIPVATKSNAATLKLPLGGGDVESRFTSRLRRTLRTSQQAGIQARWEDIDTSNLVEFVVRAQAFGRSRGFTVPPVFWFKALTRAEGPDEHLKFGLVTAQAPQSTVGCQLFIALHGTEAHYLFGHEWREMDVRSALSPSAIAHRYAIQHVAEAGASTYDFNGTIAAPDPSHAYAGVADFKSQFGADLIRYEVPEIRIGV